MPCVNQLKLIFFARMKNESLNEIDSLIRQGQMQLAQERIKAVLHLPGSRSERLKLAELCRRSNLAEAGLRLLSAYVRPAARTPMQATAAEKIEYAAALIRLGAGSEALEILSPLAEVDAFLFRAFAHIHGWNYVEAIPPLQDFLASARPTAYQKLVARVNLAACLVQTEKHPEATALLEEISRQCKDEKNFLLLGNTLELSAQNAIAAGDYEEAEKFLENAETLRPLKNQKINSFDALYLEKWRAILDLKKQGINRLQPIKKIAAGLGDAETIRDCDFHLAVATRNENLFFQLYFGTPYESYRRKIQKHCSIPSTYSYSPQDNAKRFIDLQSGEPGLKFQQVPHRLLQILAADLYKSQRLPALHGFLFPGRFYNPDSSPGILHQALRRLRFTLAKNDFPLEIVEKHSAYHLAMQGKIGLKYEISAISREKLALTRLKGISIKSFTAQTAAIALGCSKRSIITLLNNAEPQLLIRKEGQGKNTKYRLLF